MSLSSLSVRVAVACVGVLVLCSGLTACSHGDAAAKKPAMPSSTETTIVPPEGDPWPYPTPTLAPEASRDDSAGACAVAAYFLEATSYDAAHMRTDTYDKYASDDCKPCQETKETIEKARPRGGWIRGQHYQDMQLLKADSLTNYENGWACDFYVQQDEGQAWAPGRGAPYRAPSYSGTLSVFLKRDGNTWKVFDYGHDDSADAE